MRKTTETWPVQLLGYRFRFHTREEYTGFHRRYVSGRYPTMGDVVRFVERMKDLRSKGQLAVDEDETV